MRDFLGDMLNALTSAYSRRDYENRQRGSPMETNIGKLFSIFAWGLDSVHEQAELIKQWDNIDHAAGSVLDRYGANFGVKRNGARDAFYRLMIKVKLMSQLSGGDINTIINAASSMFDVPPERLALHELFPAKIMVDVFEADLDAETLGMVVEITEMLKRLLAAGVGLIVQQISVTPTDPALRYRGLSNVKVTTTQVLEADQPAIERILRTKSSPLWKITRTIPEEPNPSVADVRLNLINAPQWLITRADVE